MTLKAETQQKLERLKSEREKKLGIPLTWGSFFSLVVQELEKR
jgi:hypothetical protein